jgi:hypothetical protein
LGCWFYVLRSWDAGFLHIGDIRFAEALIGGYMNLIIAGILVVVIGLVGIGFGVADIVRHPKRIRDHHLIIRTQDQKGNVLQEQNFIWPHNMEYTD